MRDGGSKFISPTRSPGRAFAGSPRMGSGSEVNILPDPSSRRVDSHETSSGPGSAEETRDIRRLELSLSAKFLYPVRNDENVTDYFRTVRPSPSP